MTTEYIDSHVELCKVVDELAKLLNKKTKELAGILPLDGLKLDFTDFVKYSFHKAHVFFGMSIALESNAESAICLRYIAYIHTWYFSDLQKARVYLSMAREFAALTNELVILETKSDLEQNSIYQLGLSI